MDLLFLLSAFSSVVIGKAFLFLDLGDCSNLFIYTFAFAISFKSTFFPGSPSCNCVLSWISRTVTELTIRPRAVRATGEEGVPLRAALPGTSRCPRLSAAGAEAAGAPRCPGGCCCCCDRCPERGAVLRWPPLDRGLLSIPSATRADGCNLNFRLHFKRASLMLECRGERGKGTD